MLGFILSLLHLILTDAASVAFHSLKNQAAFLGESAHSYGRDAHVLGLEAAALASSPGFHVSTPTAGSIPGHQLQLSRRDCLPNGTNYCFGNNVNFCAGCGVCCGDSANKWCCAADGICCGDSCCGKGQSCRQGQCIGHPAVTTTVLGTIQSTLTRIVTKIDTVIIAGLSTSFVEAVVTIIDSRPGATYTDVTYVTTTVFEKRSEPSPASKRPPVVARAGDVGDNPVVTNVSRPSSGSLALSAELTTEEARAQAQPASILPLARRQESSRPSNSASFSTVTTTSIVTQLQETVSTVSSTTTINSISVVIQAVQRTHTREIDATTTVSTTETQTFTSRPAVTATLLVPGTNPDTSGVPLVVVTSSNYPQTQTIGASTSPTSNPNQGYSGNRGPPLSNAAIAGIAAGSAGFAALIAIAIYLFFFLRRRRVRKLQEWEDTLTGMSLPGVVYGGDIRQPRLPNIRQPITQARFAPAVFAARHHERGSLRRQSALDSMSSMERSNNSSTGGLARAATVVRNSSNQVSVTPSAYSVVPKVAELGDTSLAEMPGEGWPMMHESDNSQSVPPSSTPPGATLSISPLSPDIESRVALSPQWSRRQSRYTDY